MTTPDPTATPESRAARALVDAAARRAMLAAVGGATATADSTSLALRLAAHVEQLARDLTAALARVAALEAGLKPFAELGKQPRAAALLADAPAPGGRG
jgi:hypothetical protein